MGWYYEAPEPDVGIEGGYSYYESEGTATFEFNFNNTQILLDNNGNILATNDYDVYDVLANWYDGDAEDGLYMTMVDVIDDGFDAEVIVGKNFDDIGFDLVEYIYNHCPEVYKYDTDICPYSAFLLNGTVKFNYDVTWTEYSFGDDDSYSWDAYEATSLYSGNDNYDYLEMYPQGIETDSFTINLIERGEYR